LQAAHPIPDPACRREPGMKVQEVQRILDAELLTQGSGGADISAASASDLLSDVLAFTPVGALLLTGLVTHQAVRTAELVDASAVCFVAGMRPSLPAALSGP